MASSTAEKSVQPDATGWAALDTSQMHALRRDMLRFASLQLRDEHLAEDAVQDAMTAAFTGSNRYTGGSSVTTWVFGILKHKIVDIIRQRSQTINVSSLSHEEHSMDEQFEALFEANQHWAAAARPSHWEQPDQALRSQQFMIVLEACLRHLPDATARVFMMRELLELETHEICTELAITINHCNVMLHRARNGLRACLQKSWFQSGAPSC